MSLPDLRHILLLPLAVVLGLSACGFTPVYAPGGTGAALHGKVIVQAPEEIRAESEVDAYHLVRNLEERLGRGENAAIGGGYRLDLTLSTRSEGQAITANNATTRYSIVGTAGFVLTRQSDGAIVASGSEDGFTGYSATGSTVETLAGERDAHERLMQILADRIIARLLTTADLASTDTVEG
ncbi:LPS assembly lipoprotein LptE [Phaeobacter sp. QD34_3]|uniref:LPS assembly lipoprotein LptE n=1 Tax=unclassified Phaeobacter TaxID=2621772 RepID=UPI00237EF873|nr:MULTISPECIES: LPS assembly lipoprotein LptE [unclassified Phaeobacter]MDE4132331.1 LPS assembly lipoprotein LptE [Phaeobacter sp. QD34_3]MDE4135969.1 LPS assembly lipoprotein LptE [Phaeobacter sp. QD34_24]